MRTPSLFAVLFFFVCIINVVFATTTTTKTTYSTSKTTTKTTYKTTKTKSKTTKTKTKTATVSPTPTPSFKQIQVAFGIESYNYTVQTKLYARGYVYYVCTLVNTTTAVWVSRGAKADLERIESNKRVPAGTFNRTGDLGIWNHTTGTDTSSFTGKSSNSTKKYSGDRNLPWLLYTKVSSTYKNNTDLYKPTKAIVRVFTIGGLTYPSTRCDVKRIDRDRWVRYRAQLWLLE